ncbi:MAG: TIGR00341 family protein [Algisphaera sp.]
MPIAVVIEADWEADTMIAWAARLGRARGAGITVLAVSPPTARQADTHPVVMAAQAAADTVPDCTVQAVDPGDDAIAATLKAVADCGAKWLVLAKHERNKGPEETLTAGLFRSARCAVLVLRPAADPPTATAAILVPTAGGPHAEEALKLAAQLASAPSPSLGVDDTNTEDDTGDDPKPQTATPAPPRVDALYVEPDVGPEAHSVGQRKVEQAIRKALGTRFERPKVPEIRARVEIAPDYRTGVTHAVQEGDYNLVLVGAADRWHTRKALFDAVPDKLLQDRSAPITLGVVRQAEPLADAAARAMRSTFERWVPQLNREDRITLVERIQGASQWDVDFIALISLSTIIATFGLMQNSGAVVIGAMLVAPLMTPLIGSGLAVVQGNRSLIRHAVKAVVLGFVLAFSIAALMGLVVPHAGVTPQMLARGAPNLLDLGVAFASGLAAAYATARPNLSGALPGVAIAAALVPPIATAGVALTRGDLHTSAGASVLFLTNIIAIVFGAAVALYALGMQPLPGHRRDPNKSWRRPVVSALAIATLALSIPLGYALYAALPGRGISESLRTQTAQRIATQPGAQLVDFSSPQRKGQTLHINITRNAPTPNDPTLANDLAQTFTQHYGKPCHVTIITQLVSESASP